LSSMSSESSPPGTAQSPNTAAAAASSNDGKQVSRAASSSALLVESGLARKPVSHSRPQSRQASSGGGGSASMIRRQPGSAGGGRKSPATSTGGGSGGVASRASLPPLNPQPPEYLRPQVRSAVGRYRRAHEEEMMQRLLASRDDVKSEARQARQEAERLSRRIPTELLAKEWLNMERASIETRAFLIDSVFPTVILGLEKLLNEVQRRELQNTEEPCPNFNPINYLGQYLMRNNPRYSNFSEASPYIRGLREISEELRQEIFTFKDNKLAQLKANAKRKKLEKEEAEKRRLEEHKRKQRVIEELFDKFRVGDELRIELPVLQRAIKSFSELAQDFPDELRQHLRLVFEVLVTEEASHKIGRKEFGDFLTELIEDMPFDLFEEFTNHLGECALTYKRRAERELRRTILSDLFISCDHDEIGMLDRQRILLLFDKFYESVAEHRRQFLRNPRKWPVRELHEEMREVLEEQAKEDEERAKTMLQEEAEEAAAEAAAVLEDDEEVEETEETDREMTEETVEGRESPKDGEQLGEESSKVATESQGKEQTRKTPSPPAAKSPEPATAEQPKSPSPQPSPKEAAKSPSPPPPQAAEDQETLASPKAAKSPSPPPAAAADQSPAKSPSPPPARKTVADEGAEEEANQPSEAATREEVSGSSGSDAKAKAKAKREVTFEDEVRKRTESPSSPPTPPQQGEGEGEKATGGEADEMLAEDVPIDLQDEGVEPLSRDITGISNRTADTSRTKSSAFDEMNLTNGQFVHVTETFLGDEPKKDLMEDLIIFVREGYVETEDERLARIKLIQQRQLSAKRKVLLDELFQLWDNDGSGFLDLDEVENVMLKYKDATLRKALVKAKKELKSRSSKLTKQQQQHQDSRLAKREFRDFVKSAATTGGEADSMEELIQFMAESVERSQQERIRGAARKKWLASIRLAGEESGASMEPVYRAVFWALYRDAETHGDGKRICANLALLESNNENVAELGGLVLRYVAATPEDADFVVGQSLYELSETGVSFQVVQSGKPLHVPRVTANPSVHYFNKAINLQEVDGALAVVPLKDRQKRVFGTLAVDTVADPVRKRHFVAHEMQFFQGVSNAFSIAYHKVDALQKTLRVSESALVWICRRVPAIQSTALYMRESDHRRGKGAYCLRKVMNVTQDGEVEKYKVPPKLNRDENVFRDYLFMCVDNSESLTADAYGERRLATPLRDLNGLATAVIDLSMGKLRFLTEADQREVMKILRLLQLTQDEIIKQALGEAGALAPGGMSAEALFDSFMLRDLRENVGRLSKEAYAELRSYKEPPSTVLTIIRGVLAMFYPDAAKAGEFDKWRHCQKHVKISLGRMVMEFDPQKDPAAVPLEFIDACLNDVPQNMASKHGSKPAEFLFNWLVVCVSIVRHTLDMNKRRGVSQNLPAVPEEAAAAAADGADGGEGDGDGEEDGTATAEPTQVVGTPPPPPEEPAEQTE
ncbi:hypothetical protein BOX15_Mlig022953g2, partial [Macrostomum lignano]